MPTGLIHAKALFLFGSLGALNQLSALRWKIVAAQIPFLAVFYFLVGPRILLWLGALVLAVWVYNAPPFGWKSKPPFDVLIQASYLLVFVLSSWLNHAPLLPWPTFIFGALFAIHSHVFGEVMDIAPDRLSGRRTTATCIGTVGAKGLIAAFLCLESVLVYVYFRDSADRWIPGCRRCLVCAGCAHSLEKSRLHPGADAHVYVGVERYFDCGDVLELGARDLDSFARVVDFLAPFRAWRANLSSC